MDEGKKMYRLACELYPIYRSITGNGVRETFDHIQRYLGTDCTLNRYEIPTGKKVFDWTIPKEWKIKSAYIKNSSGETVVDFKQNCLHVVGYSAPVDKWVDWDELKQYLYTQPDQPDAIPYVTSYYKEQFGFCITEEQKQTLPPPPTPHPQQHTQQHTQPPHMEDIIWLLTAS